MVKRKQKGGFFNGISDYSLDIENEIGENDKNVLYGSSANCKQAVMTTNNKQYFLKFMVEPDKDNILIENLNGTIINNIVNNNNDVKNYFTTLVHNGCVIITDVRTKQLIYEGDDPEIEDNLFIDHVYKFNPKFNPKENLIITNSIPDEGLVLDTPTPINSYIPINVQELLLDYVYVEDILRLTDDDEGINDFLTNLNNFFKVLEVIGSKYGFVHNDAHLRNLMMNEKGNIKLIDYGRSLFNVKKVNNVQTYNIQTYNIQTYINEINENSKCSKKLNNDPYNDLSCYVKPPEQYSDKGYLFDIATISMNVIRYNDNIRTQLNVIEFVDFQSYEPYPKIIKINITNLDLNLLRTESNLYNLYSGIKVFKDYCIALNVKIPDGFKNQITNDQNYNYLTINFDWFVTNRYIYSSFQFLRVSEDIFIKLFPLSPKPPVTSRTLSNPRPISRLHKPIVSSTPLNTAIKFRESILKPLVPSKIKELTKKAEQYENVYNLMKRKVTNSKKVDLVPLKINSSILDKKMDAQLSKNTKDFAKQYIEIKKTILIPPTTMIILPKVKVGGTQTLTLPVKTLPTKTNKNIYNIFTSSDALSEYFEYVITGTRSVPPPSILNKIF